MIMRGLEPLIDEVPKRLVEKDHADTDVRVAMKSVAEKERIESMADRYGYDGIHQMENWNAEIKRSGPDAAKTAGLYYATNPRSAPEVEEERTEDEITAAARSAYRQESKKQTAEQKAAAVDSIRRLASEHGDVGIVDTFAGWHQQLQHNPYDAAPRIQREIAGRVNEAIAMQEAHQIASEYQRQHQISNEERALMVRVLNNGEAHDMSSAHKLAKWYLAQDVKDGHERDVVAARRKLEGARMSLARRPTR
jgi:hypothetical protein